MAEGRKKHGRPLRRRMSNREKRERKEVLRAIGRAAFERGLHSEDKAEEALSLLNHYGFLTFKRMPRMSVDDKNGIDFRVWGEPPYICSFTIDVKASPFGIKAALPASRRRGMTHHHFLLVEPGDDVTKVAKKILRIVDEESGRI